ncbi:MAG: DUF1499 domain-containing protein [Geobacteraceae bacterium]|nr:DUF1499 domain-containing protein [Geobacteraceae bacterium]
MSRIKCKRLNVHHLTGIFSVGIISLFLAACTGKRPDNLGARDGLLTLCPSSPNCVSSQAEDGGHKILYLTLMADPDADFARLAALLRNRADCAIVEEKSGYLRVEFHTRLFVDDGEFLLDRDKRLIHLRSASRVGYSDLGKNRERIEEIRGEFVKGGKR